MDILKYKDKMLSKFKIVEKKTPFESTFTIKQKRLGMWFNVYYFDLPPFMRVQHFNSYAEAETFIEERIKRKYEDILRKEETHTIVYDMNKKEIRKEKINKLFT